MCIIEYEELIGKIFDKVYTIDDEFMIFEQENGDKYQFYHEQDCCESVTIEDICGNLEDLEGSIILKAEEVCSINHTDSFDEDDNIYHESQTWTFYKFATAKGYVDVRWYGSSNGYYSESVNFTKII